MSIHLDPSGFQNPKGLSFPRGAIRNQALRGLLNFSREFHSAVRLVCFQALKSGPEGPSQFQPANSFGVPLQPANSIRRSTSWSIHLCRPAARVLRAAQENRATDATKTRTHTTKWASIPVSAIGRLSNVPATSVHQYEKLNMSATVWLMMPGIREPEV